MIRTIAVNFNGDISLTDKKEELFDGLYLDMEEYEKLKNSIPPMMRQSFIDILSFMFETEAELKEYMTAMNNCIMFLYVVLGVNVPAVHSADRRGRIPGTRDIQWDHRQFCLCFYCHGYS